MVAVGECGNNFNLTFNFRLLFPDNHHNKHCSNTNRPLHPINLHHKKSTDKHTNQHGDYGNDFGFHRHAFTSFKIDNLLTYIFIADKQSEEFSGAFGKAVGGHQKKYQSRHHWRDISNNSNRYKYETQHHPESSGKCGGKSEHVNPAFCKTKEFNRTLTHNSVRSR